ncbi:hypothetical protein BOX15_Mlig002476g1, partial [Macrostomum lignano]
SKRKSDMALRHRCLLVAAVLVLCASSVWANINWNGNNWAHGCDFRNNDLSNVRIPSEQCGGRCANTQGCTHFTWTQHNGGTCWMKRGSVLKSDAFPTGDMTMVCGVIEDNGGGGGGGGNKVPGFTTRYWDCCKPSCSWPGKVPGHNKYVRACYRDGYGVTSDPNGASGCNGGPVFACNNNKPWAVSDQLAYGFAAATIPGLDESGRCCACYKLDFTNGPVQGKSMVVQVTNSGGDVHPNQFDLQIPGGGVGIFNGCSAQWNAGPDGWGQRYGGVSRRSECGSLPAQIRDGCYWRFDWFRGADNPAMVYLRVRCPDALVAISGCRRDDD